MSTIKIRLFGKLSIVQDGLESNYLACNKSLILFGFLLINRESLHTREKLASLLWGDHSTSQAKQSLRQALWQLKTLLGANGSSGGDLLLVNSEWVGIDPKADLWLDIAAFEETYKAVKSIPPEQLEEGEIEMIGRAVDLYQGDLLASCYEDLCLCERERFRDMHLTLLQKLMSYFEVHSMFDRGLEYGETLLRFDHAHERTHRIMMRLRYFNGDRTGALHQYRRCREALAKELDVVPSDRTEDLYQQILSGKGELISSRIILPLTNIESATASLPEILSLLQHLVTLLPEIEERILQDLHILEQKLNSPKQLSLIFEDNIDKVTRMNDQKRRSERRLRIPAEREHFLADRAVS